MAQAPAYRRIRSVREGLQLRTPARQLRRADAPPHHGVQANMWTEYIAWRQLLLYQLLPRAAALSETQWVASAQKDYASFLRQRLPPLLRIYSLAGWNYCPPQQQE